MMHSYFREQFSRSCCRVFVLTLLFCCLGGVSEAQYTFMLTNTMSSPQTGGAIDAAAVDETVFLLTEGGGLWALRQTDDRFVTNAYLHIPDQPSMLGVGTDGLIYLANDGGMLSAYVLAGPAFKEITRVRCPHPINDLAVSDDGTIFVACGLEGLAAYRFDGATLVEIARINEGGDTRTVAVGRDGFVYVASRIETYVGMYAFNGTDFKRISRHDGAPPMANALAVSDDGLVLLADLVEGLFMYRFDGADLRPLAHVPTEGPGNGVAVLQPGQVYLASGHDGMRVYDIAGDDLLPRAHWSGVRNDARSVVAGVRETVLLANGTDGLRALECIGPDVRCIAHHPAGHEALGVVVGWDGTIFVAGGAEGLLAFREGSPLLQLAARTNADGGHPIYARAVAVDAANRVFVAHDEELSVYLYAPGAFKLLARTPVMGAATSVTIDPHGRIYMACGENGLQVFQFTGSDLYPLAQVNDGGKVMDVAVTRTGTVFVANGMDGLRAYVWSGPSLKTIAHINDGGGDPEWARRLAVGGDNTIFLACGREGLRAYRFNGVYFTPTARLALPLSGEAAGVSALDISSDGIIFFGCNDVAGSESDGVFACRYDGAALRITARAEHTDFASDIAAAPDGMLFLADRLGGVLGYEYTFAGGAFPELVVNPLSVDFGQLLIGGTSRRYITLTNAGTAMLHILGMQLITANTGEFSIVNPNPTELPPGAAMRVSVQCTPRSVGNKDAILRIISDDPEQPRFDVPMKARVGTPAITPISLYTVTLGQNIPNPFNPSTEISYFLSQPEHVRISVYDIVGRQIAILVDAQTQAGWHSVRFDGSNVPSGLYMYRLESGGNTVTRKMMLLN